MEDVRITLFSGVQNNRLLLTLSTKTEFCDGGISINICTPENPSKGIPNTPQHTDSKSVDLEFKRWNIETQEELFTFSFHFPQKTECLHFDLFGN